MDYMISCEATFKVSNGIVTFQWRGPDNNPVFLTDGFAILTQGDTTSVLQFDPARESHAGEYSCLATFNGLTLNETSADVVVNGKKLVSEFKSALHSEGGLPLIWSKCPL